MSDKIITKPVTPEYEEAHDRIFKKVSQSDLILYRKPTYKELVEAIDQFTDDRTPADINMIPLFRMYVRLDRENIKPCPECDGECDEPCNTDAETMWAQLDTMEKKFRDENQKPMK